MNWRLIDAYERCQPHIRSGWGALTASDPGRASEIAACERRKLMNDLLDQIWSFLRSPSAKRWLCHEPPVELPGWNGDDCGLEPLLVFLATGKKVLEAAATALARSGAAGSEIERERFSKELLLAFDVVIQRQIQRLCSRCPVPGNCSLSDRGVQSMNHRFGSETYRVRPLEPADAPRLLSFFASHTPETIRDRYGYFFGEMTPERAAQLVSVNQNRDLAIGVFEPAAGDEVIHAIGRYCLDPGGKSAEFALVVRESKRHLGIGGYLLRMLAEVGRARGLEELWGQIDSGNAAMLNLARRCGFTVSADPGSRETRASLNLRARRRSAVQRAQKANSAPHRTRRA